MKQNRTMQTLSFIVFTCLMSSCYTMYFHKGEDLNVDINYHSWHHGGVFGFVEFSPPYELCIGNPWKTAYMQQNFIQGLISHGTYMIYDPWTTAAECGK